MFAVTHGQRANHSVLADTRFDVIAQLLQNGCNVISGLFFLHRQFGSAMQMLKPLLHIVDQSWVRRLTFFGIITDVNLPMSD